MNVINVQHEPTRDSVNRSDRNPPRGIAGQPAGHFMRNARSSLRLAVLVAGGCLLSGCGYSSSRLYREGVKTVYVEMFQSKEFRRGIEFQLTEAVRKQIDRSTPYRNAPKEKADTIITGEVLEWREATMGRSFLTNLPRETAGTLSIRYRWQDMRTGKLLVDQRRLVTTVEYVRPVGETVYNARDDAADRMARRVVESMATSW